MCSWYMNRKFKLLKRPLPFKVTVFDMLRLKKIGLLLLLCLYVVEKPVEVYVQTAVETFLNKPVSYPDGLQEFSNTVNKRFLQTLEMLFFCIHCIQINNIISHDSRIA